MMPGDDSLVFKSWVDPEGRGKLVLTEQTWHGSSASANMCRNKVLFSQGGFFFFLPTGENTAMYGKQSILCVFPSPKMQLKQKGYLCVFWLREKEWNRFIWEENHVCPPFIPLSWTAVDRVNGAMGNELLVLRPIWCSALLLYPPSPLGVWSLYGV